MKRKKNSFTFFGGALFFITISIVVAIGISFYDLVVKRTNGNKGITVLVMFLTIVFLSAVCTVIDLFRRRQMVDKPVEKILSATEKIAAGDFSVRLQQRHGYREYDEYDWIMENLNTMTEALGKSEMLKTDFISNVSHELKTPLAVIKSYATLLKREKDEEQRKEYADILIKAAERLSDLVSNILKLSKLENDKIPAEKEKVRLDESISLAVIGLENKIEEKNLNVQCDLDEVSLFSVAGYLEIVWNNLLSNAIKFTDDGGMVEVSLKKEGEFAVVKVRDTGCGISPEMGSRIFDKFYQGDTSHAQERNGLGLALVKKVIDLLGGEISVESEQGKGTTFTVTLKE